MKNRSIMLTMTVLVAACFAVAPVAQARQQSEELGKQREK
jgi:hypothetical protein